MCRLDVGRHPISYTRRITTSGDIQNGSSRYVEFSSKSRVSKMISDIKSLHANYNGHSQCSRMLEYTNFENPKRLWHHFVVVHNTSRLSTGGVSDDDAGWWPAACDITKPRDEVCCLRLRCLLYFCILIFMCLHVFCDVSSAKEDMFSSLLVCLFVCMFV